ncbi:toxin glutamine deamidase domain-containing protein, partial [Mycolicibacterium sp.]|uniref:toxin glutamine deamidase domain-containing protein n=1 Tax=Mycolicibacterium sp. TaxID=2320850 RepID=UPI0037C992C8
MGIEIPPGLQWVSYLTGSEWPQGDETAMRRIGDYWRDAASDLSDLIPDLNRVRSETMSVLMGETADAAEEQFAMLFDGDYSVDKLSQAMSALGDLADGAGTEIEYTKLQIITSLAIAAAEIAWALAAAPETFGGSLSLIPPAEAATIMTVRQLVMMLLRQLLRKLGEAMTKTMVRRLLREAAQEIAIGLGQELAIQGFQVAQGNRDGIDWKQAGIVTAASGIGGAVGSPVGEGLTRAMGRSDNPVTNALKGALSGYGAGIAGNVAGTLGTGGDLDAVSIFGGAASSAATGGVHGAKSGSHGNSNNGNGRPDTGSPGRPDINGANGSRPNGETGNNGQQSHNGNTSTSTSNSSSDANSHAGVSQSQDTSAGSPATGTSQDPVSHTAPSSSTSTNGDGGSHSAPATHSGDSGPSGPSETSHAPAGQDGSSAQHEAGPTKEPTGSQETTSQNGTPTTDSGQQAHPSGDPKLGGDPTESSGTRPDTTSPSHPTDTNTTDTASHTTPSTPTDHTTSEPQPSAPVAQPGASTPSAPSTPSMPGPTSPSNTPTPTTPTNNPSTPQSAPAKASPTDTPAPTARPSLSDPSTAHTSTEPAGTPAARSAETSAAQDRSGQEITDQQDGQHHQDPGSKPESTIPPIAVTPVLPHAGGDSTSTRTGGNGRPDASTPRMGIPEKAAPSTPERPGTHPNAGQDNPGPDHHTANIHSANHAGPVGNPSDSRVFGPHELRPVENPTYQTAVENALRNADGEYAVHADPRTNAYGNLINDGGPGVDGRRNNCLDCSLSALASFRGDPTVSAPRFPDRFPDGTFDNRSGERSGLQRATDWLGGPVTQVDPSLPIADRFAAIHQQIADLGPGASALVVNEWHASDPQTGVPLYHPDGRAVVAGSHATVVVYPENAAGPVWWDPQMRTTSDQPPAGMVARSASLWTTVVPPSQGVHDGAAGDKGTGSRLPGGDPAERAVQRVPVRERMDLHGGSPPGGESGSRPGYGESDRRQTIGDRDGSVEPADGSGGAGVRGGETVGSPASRTTDLSLSVEHHTASDTGGRRGDSVSADGGVADRSARTDTTVSGDHQQADVSSSASRTNVEPGHVRSGVGQPTEQRDLARAGSDPGLTGRNGADRIGAPRDPADNPPP